MTSMWPKYITFKNVFAQSVRSRIDPTQLTATDKLTFARARIWHSVLGGNVRTGLKIVKKPLDMEARLKYFEYAFREHYLPYAPPKDSFHFYINDLRALRVLREGKVRIQDPKRTKWHVPKYELKRFLLMAEKRKKQAAENLVLSPIQARRKEEQKLQKDAITKMKAEAAAAAGKPVAGEKPNTAEVKTEEKPKTADPPKGDKPQSPKGGGKAGKK